MKKDRLINWTGVIIWLLIILWSLSVISCKPQQFWAGGQCEYNKGISGAGAYNTAKKW